jgi:hypothetical protein
MRIRFHRWLGLAIMTLAATTSSVASAQDWLEDRDRTEGPGIKAGDLELHPGLGAEVGYDSNVFYADQGEEGSALLRVTPHFYLSTSTRRRPSDDKAKPPTIRFRGGVAASYYGFFATRYGDDIAEVISTSAGLNLVILPERPFNLTFMDELTRTVRPFTETSGTDPTFARWRNDVGARLGFASKSNVLKGGLGYTFGLDSFEDRLFEDNDSFTHTVKLDTGWLFLPRTTLLYDADVAFQDYPNWNTGSATWLSDNTRLSTRVGINGVLSPRISATALVGYGAGFFDAGEDYDDINGSLELRFNPSQTFMLSLGYERAYRSSFVGNYVRRDRGYLGGDLMMGGTFLLSAKVHAGLYKYGVPRTGSGALYTTNPDPREDVRIGASLSGEYRFTDWLAMTGSLAYETDITDYEYDLQATSLTTGLAIPPDPAGYNKFEGWLGLRVFY